MDGSGYLVSCIYIHVEPVCVLVFESDRKKYCVNLFLTMLCFGVMLWSKARIKEIYAST
jgi:hypothetical protein